MSSIVRGTSATLESRFYSYSTSELEDVTSLTVKVTRTSDNTVVQAATSSGITHPSTGTYLFAWSTDPGMQLGDYLVFWQGTDASSTQAEYTEVVSLVDEDSTTLYASLEQFKAIRRITHTDDDLDLEACLAAACRQIDQKAGRRFYRDSAVSARIYGTTGRVTRDGRLMVDDIASTDGLVVETGADPSWSTASGTIGKSPDNAITRGVPITSLTIGSGWWTSQVRITAQWGWPAVPDDISRAALILANRLYMRKDSPQGVAGSAEWGAIRLSRWDPDVEALISPYTLHSFA